MHIENAEEDADLDGLAPNHLGFVHLFDQHHLAIAHGGDLVGRGTEWPGRNPEEPQHQTEQDQQGAPHAPLQPSRDLGNLVDQHRQGDDNDEEDEDHAVSRGVDVHGAKIRKAEAGWPRWGQK